ncbi:MAG: sigma-70 family RNA polymerase sigma factor [candidate division Zixibacteria bacterium]|nr:sigma-70 family RNA polymerase sigma factor [candidate division Zixibacteria bacterium]
MGWRVWGVVIENISELVERFKAGDERAFNELVRLFEKRIYAHAYQMLGNHTEADEVLQETFVRLVKNIARLKTDANFPSFLFKIATNYCIDIIRKRQRKYVVLDDEEAEDSGRYQLELSRSILTPEDEQENKQLLELINAAIAELPPKQRATIVLHDVDGYSKEEIAQMMDCPQATVRSNLHIARSKVKQKLKEILDRPLDPDGRNREER